jgi:hypothetical protein
MEGDFGMESDRDTGPLLEFLERVPAIQTPIGNGVLQPSGWWVKFGIAVAHPLAWRTVQELGHVLNYLSINERFPTAFKPVSPPPYRSADRDSSHLRGAGDRRGRDLGSMVACAAEVKPWSGLAVKSRQSKRRPLTRASPQAPTIDSEAAWPMRAWAAQKSSAPRPERQTSPSWSLREKPLDGEESRRQCRFQRQCDQAP